MEVQLKELLEKIKSEGIESAEAEAKKIRERAEQNAAAIVESARKEAASALEKAKQDAERARQSGEAALKQAARDMLLNVQSKLKELFQQLVNESIREAYSPKILEEAIVVLLKGWKADSVSDLKVVLPADKLSEVEKSLRSRLSTEVQGGLAIEAAPGMDSGFRLVRKDGSAYYDFSAKSIAEILGEYLNPRLATLLRDAVQDR